MQRTRFPLSTYLLLNLAITFQAPAFCAEKTVAPAPNVSLRAYWQESLAIDKHKPLMLAVLLSNDEAYRTTLSNLEGENLLKSYEELGLTKNMDEAQKKNLSERAKAQPVPSISIGSAGKNLSAMISVTVETADHKRVPVTVRALAETAKTAGGSLSSDNSIELLYGIDPAALEKLAAGTYTIKANVKSAGEDNSWRGEATSNNVQLDVLESLPDSNRAKREYEYGRFYLYDHAFDKAEQCAGWLIDHDSQSISGWELKGDALFGEGKLEPARDAYQRGIDLYRANVRATAANTVAEPPNYLLRRLREVLAAIEKGRKASGK